jgi:AcrR family transcriptional regulator
MRVKLSIYTPVASMRKYELKQRAASQLATRQRIVDAAIELHRERGPARTSVSEVARRAGVERRTLYRHFPDARALQLACSATFVERDPMPDPENWLALEGQARLTSGLTELYAFYERNEEMLSRVLADADYDELTREINAMRFGPRLEQTRTVLAQALPRRRALRAMLDLAIDFGTWQHLRRSGLTTREAVQTMVRSLESLS